MSSSAPFKLLKIICLVMTGATSLLASPPGDGTQWQKTFDENFTSISKNGSNFTTDDGNTFVTTFWWGTGSIGDGSACYYTDANISCDGNNLSMSLKRESNGSYTGALANTYKTFTQEYGYFESRIKIPFSIGAGPYMGLPPMSTKWPPELEMFEIPGAWSKDGSLVHFLMKTDGVDCAPVWKSPTPFQNDYHVFGCLWESNGVTFYIDDVERGHCSNSQVGDAFLNFGMGGGDGCGGCWTGDINQVTTTQTMLIDWVRVYKRGSSQPTAPSITLQPISKSISEGRQVTFTVNANGSTPLSYQWQRNGAPISGATTSSYSFVVTAVDNNAKFSVVVKNSVGSVTSNEATLTVVAFSGLQIKVAQNAPVIDGNGNDACWTNVQSTAITKKAVGVPTSSADLSATFKTVWDAQNLYVLVNVTDDILTKLSTGAPTHNDDGVAFYIDADNSRGTSLDADDFLMFLGWNNTIVTEFRGLSVNGVQYSTANVAGGYALEGKIPWSVPGINATSGYTLGFDVAINDNDNGTSRKSMIAWADSTNGAWNNPSLLEYAMLVNGLSTTVLPRNQMAYQDMRAAALNSTQHTEAFDIQGRRIAVRSGASDGSHAQGLHIIKSTSGSAKIDFLIGHQ